MISKTVSIFFLKKSNILLRNVGHFKVTSIFGSIEMEFKLKHATVSFNLHTL